MNERAMEKIKKCLRLAKSDNPAEAAAALRQAQKLMAKHGYTSSDLALAEVSREGSKSVPADNPAEWVWALMHMVAKAFGTECIHHTERSPTNRFQRVGMAQFIGVGDAPRVASYAYEVLFRQLKRDRTQYLQSLPSYLWRSDKTRKADLFARAWVQAVRAKVTELAVPKEQSDLVARWKERQYGEDGILKAKDRSHGGRLSAADRAAIDEGLEAGERASLFHGVGSVVQPERIGTFSGEPA